MNTEIPVDVNGVTFVAHVDLPDGADTEDYQIVEIYPDISCNWPFKHGLYDYLNDFTMTAIHGEVFDRLREMRATNMGELYDR